MKASKKYQIILVAFLLVICMVVFYILHHKKIEKPVAVIYKNGEIVKSIDLSSVTEEYEFIIEDGANYNRIRVDEEGVSIIEASCPDKVCIKTGHVHDSLLPITCLPNKLMIKIENATESNIDATAY